MTEDEEKETAEAKAGERADNSGEGSKHETTPLIDIANAAAERMEKANKETARLQEIQAERDTRIALGGRAEAGGQPAEKKEETDKEYVDRMRENGWKAND